MRARIAKPTRGRRPPTVDRPLINADKPQSWKADVAASVDQFNDWFMKFAPRAFREARVETVETVKAALHATRDLRAIDPDTIRSSPLALSTLRMSTAPPLAVDRLIGLASTDGNLVKCMEQGKLPPRMKAEELQRHAASISRIIEKLLDRDIFPWLAANRDPTEDERDRASTIVADRLCSAVANPIVRNAQEKRQLALIGAWLEKRGHKHSPHPKDRPLTEMAAGTFAFRMSLPIGRKLKVNIPVDVVVQPKTLRANRLPVLIEAKSAGDFTNTNKRRKEEATKIRQLKERYGKDVDYVLFLCGYFGPEYLGYEAAEGLDWIWEHRIDDLAALGL